MKSNQPAIIEWKDLYKASIRFKALACWEWMGDDEIFGVQNPYTDEIGYCCVIGNLGEAYGLIVYTGTKGLNSYLKIQSRRNVEGFDFVIIQQCISIQFASREYLAKEDLQTIKEAGFKFRGKDAYPVFRTMSPGYYPWFLSKEEVIFATIALQQAIDVCSRRRENENLFDVPYKNNYFVRVATRTDKGIEWADEWREPDPLEPQSALLPIDELQLRRIISKAVQSGAIWEADYFYADMPVKEKGTPYYPSMLLIIDHASGQIINFKLSNPEDYRNDFISAIMEIIEQSGVIPQEILTERDETAALLTPLVSVLKIKLTKVKRLKEFNNARKHFEQFHP